MSLNPRKLEVLKTIFQQDTEEKKAIIAFLKNAVSAFDKVINKKVDAALSRLRNGRDGKDGKDGKPGKDGKDGQDGLDGVNGQDGSPDSPQDILTKLLSIKVPWLTKKDREEMELLIKQAAQEGRQLSVGAAGGGRGFYVYIDGVKKGIIKELNFKAGTGMAIAYSEVLGRPTLTFNASASGLTVETPPETPDASITAFTVTAEPQWVVADGTTYFDGKGYTYAALQITMDIPPSQSIRVII